MVCDECFELDLVYITLIVIVIATYYYCNRYVWHINKDLVTGITTDLILSPLGVGGTGHQKPSHFLCERSPGRVVVGVIAKMCVARNSDRSGTSLRAPNSRSETPAIRSTPVSGGRNF